MFNVINHHKFLNFHSPYWNSWQVVYDAPETKYPPYDIDKDGENFILTFAVAGFKKDELTVKHVKREKKLIVSGEAKAKEKTCGCGPDCNCSVKQGIAKRPFSVEFAINDAKITYSKLEDGILTLVVEPVDPPKDEVETIEIQ